MSSGPKEKDNQRNVKITNSRGIVIGDFNKVVNNFFGHIDEKLLKRFRVEQLAGFGVVSLIVIIGVWVLLHSLKSPSFERMPGYFNIAVSDFVVINGDKKTEMQSMSLANAISEQIQSQISDGYVGGELPVTVWGPAQIEKVNGSTQSERAQQAEKLAELIGADIVVCGVIDNTNIPWNLTIEFYISPLSFYEADDMFIGAESGYYQLGEPIALAGLDSTAERIQIGTAISSRINVLSQIVLGLAYYLPPTPDYQNALSVFDNVLHTLTLNSQFIDKQSLKVVYVIAGNVAGRATVDDFDNDTLALSEAYYRDALDVDPQYARAYIGLGSVYYLQAIEKFSRTKKIEDIDVKNLEEAHVYYQMAVEALNQPLLADIDVKYHFGVGQVYLLQWMVGDVSKGDMAIQEFEEIIRKYETTHNFRIQEMASEAHARLGLIYSSSTNPDLLLAAEEYKKAAELARNLERRELFQKKYEKLLQNSHP